ncbi:MAG: IS110 family transposase, partial [Spirochaetales bacterium]|nr:IS110 family transposase [Spirochaetales bacterium]
MEKYSKFVGLDTHKEKISVSIADSEGGLPRYYGEISNRPTAIGKLVKKLSPNGEAVSYCYEAGPCGYGIYHQITALGQNCDVVAPSLIPRKPGERIKTDRRDSEMLARLSRAGELTAVWVPDKEQEAFRDLTRCREDMKNMERQARQRLGSFLLRHGYIYRDGKSKWTQAHFKWMENLKFDNSIQQIVFEEYISAVKQAQRRVSELEEEMRKSVADWHFAPVVEALMALRGVNFITAMTVMAELGDITRFDSPRQFMSYLGLVPSEHSSGLTQRRGGITKTGNG